MKIYINSTEKASSSYPGTLTIGSTLFTIGDGKDINWYPFLGSVDEVRIYNRALTPEEISVLYETTAPNTAAMKITKDTVYLKGEFKEVI